MSSYYHYDDLVYYYMNREVIYGENIYSGRLGSNNFPGVDGRPPLIIQGCKFEYYFHSDGKIAACIVYFMY